MNDLQITSTIFIASLMLAFFHFSGFVAGKGSARNGDWTAMGAVPLIMISIIGAASLVATLYHALTPP